MAIRLIFNKAEEKLTGRSHFWGCPDLPDSLEYPEVPVNEDGELYYEPLAFLCQIRCEDLTPFDREGLLPHCGMLYFFAAMDYFLGQSDAMPSPGMGEWNPQHFKVLYTPSCENLHTHTITYSDGSEFGLPAEKISFERCEDFSEDFRLLGKPWLDEVREQYPDYVSLLQIDENDEWNLRFYDCGMLNFLIKPQDLAAGAFNKALCHLYSF